MAWSGAIVAAALVQVGVRVVPRMWRADVGRAAKLHVLFAFTNIAVAALAGVVLGFDKVHHFLPGYVITNVLAHAHLAALGWAAMLALGIANLASARLFHGAPARRSLGEGGPTSPAWLLQAAALALFCGLATGTSLLTVVGGLCAAAAFVRVARHALAHWRVSPGLSALTAAEVHALQGVGYALVTVAIGMVLLVAQPSEATMRLALLYGLTGLVGFLAQLVLGIQSVVCPAIAARWPTCLLWSIAVPLMACGFMSHADGLLAAGAWLGFAASAGPAAVAASECLWSARWLSWVVHGERRRSAARQLDLPQGRA